MWRSHLYIRAESVLMHILIAGIMKHANRAALWYSDHRKCPKFMVTAQSKIVQNVGIMCRA